VKASRCSRARAYLREVVASLSAAGLRYQATEIAALADRPVIQDLTALTLALLHPAHRIAWLSVLRAPWCGISLADLHALAAHDHRWCLRDWFAGPSFSRRSAPMVKNGCGAYGWFCKRLWPNGAGILCRAGWRGHGWR